MKRITLLAIVSLISSGLGIASVSADERVRQSPSNRQGSSQGENQNQNQQKYPPFDKVVEGAEKIDGFLTLYHNKKEGKLFAEIKGSEMNQPMLAPMAIARGLGMAGHPLHQMDQWVLLFRRSGEHVQIVRRNVHYEAPQGQPIAKAMEQNFTDSIIMAVPVRSERGGGVLIDMADIFFRDFARLGIGGIDRSRTRWHDVKAFDNNIDVEVEATFTGGGLGSGLGLGGASGVIDSRGITVVIHYTLAALPRHNYRPRMADNRVGHFLNATKDYGKEDPDTYFVRRLNRWHLQKANPQAELSAPKERIVWWVEDTVPYEFRPYVEAGIEEWNKAFEKIGFKRAIEVRWQGPGDEFEPENIDYCTFKWMTSGSTYAMSGIRANPLTGEIVDGDVVFDASWIKYWKRQYAFLVESATSGDDSQGRFRMPLARGEIVSPILAAKEGFGLPFPLPDTRERMRALREEGKEPLEVVPSDVNPLRRHLRQQMVRSGGQYNMCQYNSYQAYQLGLAAMVMAAEEAEDNGEKKKDQEKKDEAQLSTEFLGEAIKMVVMHEVGHSLGLRHNFKASSIRKNAKLHDRSMTQEKGLVGSVMDYLPANIALDRDKQGEYYPNSIGPYDYWAIEYAYNPVQGNEEKALDKIASRSPEPDLKFATDEDLYVSHDPYVNTWDLGTDPVAFGKTRMELASRLVKDLDERLIKEGQSWSRLRDAFNILLAQYGDGATLASDFIGGQRVHRDHKGPEARDPVVPVSGKKQRSALKAVVRHILSEDAFDFPPQLLRRLTTERWYHWGTSAGMGGDVQFPIYQRILSIQRIVLNQCFDAGVLERLQNQQLMAEGDQEPLTIAEVFKRLTNAIWAETKDPGADLEEEESLELTTVRRNLQREHLKKLTDIVIGSQQSPYFSLYSYVYFSGASSYPPDAKSLARLHLKKIRNRIERVLEADDVDLGATTRAHLDESYHRIEKVLEASLEVSQAW